MYYKYRHYIFDLRALVDTSTGVRDAFCYALEQMGLPSTDNGEIGYTPFEKFLEPFGLIQEDSQRAISIYQERFAQVERQRATAYLGIEKFLQYLWESGYRISVITRERTNLARAILRRQNLLQYIHGVFGADTPDAKTEEDLIRACMQPTAWRPCQTIVIGNDLSDFEAAKECGISFLGAGYGMGNISEAIPLIDIPSEGYWGVIDDSCSFISRFEEITETDITPPAVLKDGPVEVSVIVLTYNHAEYVRECLDSVLMQKADFRFEILVGDDASPDDTQDILREYMDRYPSVFRMELRQENIGGTKNVYDLFQKAQGKYIAFVEGDDYWTDIYKLQIQYDFLEQNPSYSFCTHRIVWVSEHHMPLPDQHEDWLMPPGKTITLKDLDGYHMPGLPLCEFMRNFWKSDAHDWSIQYVHPIMGDTTTWLLLLLQGDGFCIDRVMGHYRRVVRRGRTNAVSVLYNNPNYLFESFLYLCTLEDYAKQEFGIEVYFSRREWVFSQVVRERIKSRNPRHRANVKKMIEVSKAPWKYRYILMQEYVRSILKAPKYFLKKLRNRYHSLLLERLGICMARTERIIQRQNSLDQQMRSANRQLRSMSEQIDILTEKMNELIEQTDMRKGKDT